MYHRTGEVYVVGVSLYHIKKQCSGMTLRDGMGREVGERFRWGTHEHPWLIHVDVWLKPLQYCKVIKIIK